MQKRQLFPEFRRTSQSLFLLPGRIRGPERFRDQVEEYEPLSLSAEDAVLTERESPLHYTRLPLSLRID